MTSPDFEPEPYLENPFITETDFAQRAVRDALGRVSDLTALPKIIPHLNGPLGNRFASRILGRLLNDRRFNPTQIVLQEQPVTVFKRELIRVWKTYFALPSDQQRVMRESARQEFQNSQGK